MVGRLTAVVSLMLMLVACGWGVVDPGERAVFARFGEVEKKCYPEGLYFYNPFTTDMYMLDVKVQKLLVRQTEAATRDLQTVTADIVINFVIDPKHCEDLILLVGKDFKDRVMIPAVHETLKVATAQFAAEKVIQERARLREIILKELKDRMNDYRIQVVDVALTDFAFSPDFAKAVEVKQIEEQNVQRAEYQRQQAVKEAESQVARARGQAEANRLIRESLTADLIQFEAIKRWDGKLPQVTGNGAVPFIRVGGEQP